jgi:hypothetical protein
MFEGIAGEDRPELTAQRLIETAQRARDDLWEYRDILGQLSPDQIYLYSTTLGSLDNMLLLLDQGAVRR